MYGKIHIFDPKSQFQLQMSHYEKVGKEELSVHLDWPLPLSVQDVQKVHEALFWPVKRLLLICRQRHHCSLTLMKSNKAALRKDWHWGWEGKVWLERAGSVVAVVQCWEIGQEAEAFAIGLPKLKQPQNARAKRAGILPNMCRIWQQMLNRKEGTK